jgi:hypothetical protein
MYSLYIHVFFIIAYHRLLSPIIAYHPLLAETIAYYRREIFVLWSAENSRDAPRSPCYVCKPPSHL